MRVAAENHDAGNALHGHGKRRGKRDAVHAHLRNQKKIGGDVCNHSADGRDNIQLRPSIGRDRVAEHLRIADENAADNQISERAEGTDIARKDDWNQEALTASIRQPPLQLSGKLRSFEEITVIRSFVFLVVRRSNAAHNDLTHRVR